MVDIQIFWLIFHVLILVYWLGADISVFYGSSQLTNNKNSIETRLAIIKIISFVNWFPNIANILIFPVGIMLLVGLGYFSEVGELIYLVWVPFFFWFFFITGSITQRGTYIGKVYSYLDTSMRIILICFVYLGVSFLYFLDVILIEEWVLLKFYLYGFILICSFGIRYSYSDFTPTFKKLIENGSTPEIEKKLNLSRNKVKPWVISLWIGLVLLSYIGISKPGI
ncbi:MAG: hypothetical protein CMM49_09920 [Rhodospirillaceae bacterium]|mgnify:CR=1 FL=1|nr:hypothetical protein [Rhodospirillaceae bacterium]